MTATSQDVVNEALALTGYDGQPISAGAPNFDSSTPGQVAQRTYPYAVQAVARLREWSFARTSATLSTTGNLAPFPWKYEYKFPTGCIDVWQLAPASLTDANNPVPVGWARGVAIVSSVQSSVIWTNLASAHAIFDSNPLESTWDPLFRAAVVRYLASEFCAAIFGKPDLAAMYAEQWQQLAAAGMERTDQ